MKAFTAPPRPYRLVRLGEQTRKFAIAAGVFSVILGGYVGASKVSAAIEEARAVLPDGAAPSPCTLWFVGSSTMYRWTTLNADMAPWDVRRRGVNGAVLPQIVRRFNNDPAGRPPAGIVVYAGENDIADGATGVDAFANFQAFMDAKTRRYGGLPVIAISLKPSPGRWDQRGEQTVFNEALRHYAASRRDLSFVDMRPLLLVNGQPGPFYASDGLHINQQGYRRWSRMLHVALARMLPRSVVSRCHADGPGT